MAYMEDYSKADYGFSGGGGPNYGALATGAVGLGALFGAYGSTGKYDPENRALKRFYELTDPNSDHFKRLRALYGKYLADASPTTDSLLANARAGGSSATSASALSYEQNQANSGRNREQVLNLVNRSILDSEQAAQGYLGLDYQMQAQAQESRGSFFDQVLGLSGGLLSKILV